MTKGILSTSGYSEPGRGFSVEGSLALSEAFSVRVAMVTRAFAPLLRNSLSRQDLEEQTELARAFRSQLLLASERLYNGRFQVAGLDFKSQFQQPGAVLADITRTSRTI